MASGAEAARVAVIADIHGNLFALEAVEADAASQGVREIVVAGDLVGRGPMGSAVVERVMSRGWRCLRGNHEDYLLSFRQRTVPEAWWALEEWACSRWMAAELGASHEAFIAGLPMTLTSAESPQLRLVHGSPRSHSEGLGPWCSDAELEGYLGMVEESVLVCAHTHRPMLRELSGGRRVVNVGSVGLPFNGDWRAQYAIFTLSAGAWSVEFRQVAWDRAGFLAHYATSGFLEEGKITAALLRREVETARPALVPFLRWASVVGREATLEALGAFDAVYDPKAPMERFEAALRALGSP